MSCWRHSAEKVPQGGSSYDGEGNLWAPSAAASVEKQEPSAGNTACPAGPRGAVPPLPWCWSHRNIHQPGTKTSFVTPPHGPPVTKLHLSYDLMKKRASQVVLVVKNLSTNAGDMATHSSILAWRIPWTEEPGGLQSIEMQRVGHD